GVLYAQPIVDADRESVARGVGVRLRKDIALTRRGIILHRNPHAGLAPAGQRRGKPFGWITRLMTIKVYCCRLRMRASSGANKYCDEKTNSRFHLVNPFLSGC